MYGMTPIVRNAATLAHNIIYKYKDQLQAGILIAGIKQNVCLGGSGSTYIYGFVDSNYRPDMTEEEGLEFVRRGSD